MFSNVQQQICYHRCCSLFWIQMQLVYLAGFVVCIWGKILCERLLLLHLSVIIVILVEFSFKGGTHSPL